MKAIIIMNQRLESGEDLHSQRQSMSRKTFALKIHVILPHFLIQIDSTNCCRMLPCLHTVHAMGNYNVIFMCQSYQIIFWYSKHIEDVYTAIYGLS